MKAFNLYVDEKFYDEMMKPTLDDVEIMYKSLLMSFIRKLNKQKRLSNYALDSEIFKSGEYKAFRIYHNTNYIDTEIKNFRETFAPNLKGRKKVYESNKYLKDEIYGFFYNYDDMKMVELARKYSDVTYDKTNNSRETSFVYYSYSDNIDFLRTLKSDYDMDRVIKKYISIMNDDTYNIYKDVSDSNKEFHTLESSTVDAKDKHLSYCRLSFSKTSYVDIMSSATKYFIPARRLLNAIIYYVNRNIEDFEDCKIESRSRKERHANMNMYNYIVEKYNIDNSDNEEYRSIIESIDIDKLEKYILNNRQEFLPLKGIKRSRWNNVRLQTLDDNTFNRLNKIRKAYSIPWVDIVRVALEKDLLKK